MKLLRKTPKASSDDRWQVLEQQDAAAMDLGYEAALPFLASQPGELDGWFDDDEPASQLKAA